MSFTPQSLQPSYVSAPPQQNVSTIGNLPNVDPAAILSGAQPAIQGYSSAISGALAPQFAQQRLALNEELANAGISGGSAPGAQQQLGLQQQAQLTGDIQPGILQMLGLGLNAAQGNQGTALQGAEFNAGAQNTGNQFDITNLIQSALANSQMGQQASEYGAGLQNQDWLAQLGASNQLAMGGAEAQTGAFQPTFQQPAPVNFGGTGAFPTSPQPNNQYSPGNPQMGIQLPTFAPNYGAQSLPPSPMPQVPTSGGVYTSQGY